MLDEITALHTAARRYCIARAPWLDPRALEEAYRDPAFPWEDEDDTGDATPAQIHVLTDVLREIERGQPANFRTLDELREYLVTAGRTATHELSPWHHEQPPTPEVVKAREVERDRFCGYVEQLSAEDLQSIRPLPYRRALSKEEVEHVWNGLNSHWGDLRRASAFNSFGRAPHVFVEGAHRFDWVTFAEHVPLDDLRQAVVGPGVRRIWQICQDPWGNYELALEAFVPYGEEGYWTSESFDWIMYCDHDYRLAIGGDRLLATMQRMWPDWQRFVV